MTANNDYLGIKHSIRNSGISHEMEPTRDEKIAYWSTQLSGAKNAEDRAHYQAELDRLNGSE